MKYFVKCIILPKAGVFFATYRLFSEPLPNVHLLKEAFMYMFVDSPFVHKNRANHFLKNDIHLKAADTIGNYSK